MADSGTDIVERPYRIGAGAGFAGDRMDPAIDLAEGGELNALVFECLAERTIALAQKARTTGGSGFDSRIVRRIQSTLPAMQRSGGVIVTNAGAADPRAAAAATRQMIADDDLGHVAVAAVTGDDVLDRLDLDGAEILETGEPLSRYRDRIVSANAYLGAEGMMEALDAGASVVITGRVGDPSLFVAPILHAFGKTLDDLDFLARATLVGHLLECAGQLTGGYFADSEMKVVPRLAELGFPFADVTPSGRTTFSKLAGTGGLLDRRTALEQLYYEVENPARYITPDLAVDLSSVSVTELGTDHVMLDGIAALDVPPQLKVSVGINDGYRAFAEVSYAGYRCHERAALAAEIISERWVERHHLPLKNLRVDAIGHNSMRPWFDSKVASPEIRMRFSTTSAEVDAAQTLCDEVEALYTNGPAGGGGVTTKLESSIGIFSVLIPRTEVQPEVWMS